MYPVLTKGLSNFRQQFDARFPNRDRTSDGWIGDAAHQLRPSGHNPDDTPGSLPEWNGDPDQLPEVRALDLDADLRDPAGVTMGDVLRHLAYRVPNLGTVFRYMIFDGLIYHSHTDFVPEVYTLPDKHTGHAHFSGAYAQTADDDTTFDYQLFALGNRGVMLSLGGYSLRQLRYGESDQNFPGYDHIWRVQKMLGIPADGIYGPVTANALRRYMGGDNDGRKVGYPEWVKLYGLSTSL